MITAIIGHRGSGKSSFLKRLEGYFAELKLSDRASPDMNCSFLCQYSSLFETKNFHSRQKTNII